MTSTRRSPAVGAGILATAACLAITTAGAASAQADTGTRSSTATAAAPDRTGAVAVGAPFIWRPADMTGANVTAFGGLFDCGGSTAANACDVTLIGVQAPFPAGDTTSRVATATGRVVLDDFRVAGRSCPLPGTPLPTDEGNCPVDWDVVLYQSDATGARGPVVEFRQRNPGVAEVVHFTAQSTRSFAPGGGVAQASPTTHWFLLEAYAITTAQASFEGTARLDTLTYR